MCIPALIPLVASAASAIGSGAAALGTSGLLSIGSGVLGAIGSYQQSAAQKSQAKYSAAVANANAKMSEFKAQDALDRGQRNAEDVGRQQANLRGRQKAGLAANGLDLSSGTPEDILASTDYYGSQDQATSANNAGREAFGFRSQGSNYTAEAGAQTARANSISPFASAGISLLGSATKIAGKWFDDNPGSNRPGGAQESPWSFTG